MHVDYLTSFDQLRWYGDVVQHYNPVSHINIDYDLKTSQFKRFFVAFPACINGFKYCRLLLFHDGIFLKGRYKGQLLAATAKDDNQVAFAIVDSESESNWSWFLYELSKIMMANEEEASSKLNHLRFEFLSLNHFYYQDVVTVRNKGLQMKLVTLLNVFTSINFSCNNFQGEIPKEIGDLKSLYVLNLSLTDRRLTTKISVKLLNWTQTNDCCSWKGVTCDKAGHLTGLDLNRKSISCGINHSSILFSLQFLQNLNWAHNNFTFTQIPPGFSKLTRLTYLNLSNANVAGRIPIELLYMTNLVTLDLSTHYFSRVPSLKLENPNLLTLVQNLTGLKQLILDGVNISTQGSQWCEAISSSLPYLQILSLSNCYLSGPIDSSLQKL
ncbi:hypothetical protein HYC85_022169 [Camellia sinensis]|uniref:Leucine-rich repeat-containing N-terminal plant-type domain-containing protein n=1 Tax=Camellia sinensis TaxID=4442 RepID=A0A7J7GJL0_CAMSI|nr:hypothetical protein HYC85_022169 [Camellia sinensis]